MSFKRNQAIESKDLWEKAEYTAVKPINCLAKYKLAMPSQVVCFQGCEKCELWQRMRNVSSITTTLPAFAISAKTKVQCSTIQLSIPNTKFHVDKWYVFGILCLRLTLSYRKAICEKNLSNDVHVVFTPSYRVSSGLAIPGRKSQYYMINTEKYCRKSPL